METDKISADMQKNAADGINLAVDGVAEINERLMIKTFNLLNDSVSLGIMSSYLDAGDLPPFYINDKLLSIMGGYEKEEFFTLMQGDSFAIVHPDDKERVPEEIVNAIETNGEYECRYRLVQKSGAVRWVSEHGKKTTYNGREILFAAFVDISNVVEMQQESQEKNDIIFSSLKYALRLQKSLLPSPADFRKAFADFSILWSPKDVVGGDIYWLRTFSEGTVLVVGDCTGHGTSGAMLTMLVFSVLDSVVSEENCRNLPWILMEFDRRTAEVLNTSKTEKISESILNIRDGCDIAILFIAINGEISFVSSNVPLFVCDGQKVTRYRGQRFAIGEGHLKSREDVRVVEIASCAENAYYIASDGLFDQVGGNDSMPWGTKDFKEILLSSYGNPQEDISKNIWDAFESYRGEQIRRDDIELLSFRTFC